MPPLKTSHRSMTQALSDSALTLGRGGIFTLPGRNGAGKTTFLRIAATQLMPSKGRISVLGHDHGKMVLSGSPAELLRNVKERVRVDIVGSTFSEEELSRYGRVVKLAERFRVLTEDRLGRDLADEALKRGSDVGLARVSLEDLFVELVVRSEE